MKKIQSCFKIILFMIIINLFIVLDVSAATNPYSQSGPYGTNCTWYVWKMASEKAGISLPGWGNAKDWYNDAKNDGYTVGTTPKANSIVVWGDWTSYGHVGYVESVEGDTIHVWDSTGPCIDEDDTEYRECMANGVSEESDRICKANAPRVACKYTLPSDYTITGYIYLDIAPKTQTPIPLQDTNTTSKKDDESTNIKQKSSNANLSNIELSRGTINFNKEILEYNVEVENEIGTITINATSEDSNALISGIGNYELNVGENEIKLIVTSEDGSTKEYTIKITRNEKLEVEQTLNNDNNKTKNETSKDNNQISILIICVFTLIIFTICLIIILKKKKNNKNFKK